MENVDKTVVCNFIEQDYLVGSAAKLKGTILEYMGDNESASYYVTSLKKDIFCSSSGRKLFENKMITPKEVIFENLIIYLIGTLFF